MKKSLFILILVLILSACGNYNTGVAGDEVYYEDEIYYADMDEYNTEDYEKINENPFKNAIQNPVTTFSVDVDTASYSNIRRFIENKQLPPIDAVRIEEMINYFNYDYEKPKDEEKFSINLEMGNCPWNQKHKLFQIGIKGVELEEENIPNSNLVFLIDVSGSMSSDNKLSLVKKSLDILVENLRDEDIVSIVVYADAEGVVLNPTKGSEKKKIMDAINKLEAGGSTAGGEGIKLAYKLAEESFIENGNNRVILATDGDFNVGLNGSDLERYIEEKREKGVYLTILGYGMGNYKDAMLERLTNVGNGNYAYIDKLEEAEKVLGNELFSTLYTIAKDVKIQIEFNPKFVKGYRLIGYENRVMENEDFNNDKKDAGDIGAGHTVTAFYEIIESDSDEEVPGIDELEYQEAVNIIDSDNLMTIKFRYKNIDSDESILIEKRPKKEEVFKENNSENFNFATAVIEFGLLLKKSEYKADANIDAVIERAIDNKKYDEYKYKEGFVELLKKYTKIID